MPNALSALELAKELIGRKSITPADGGCQELIAKRLSAVGFKCEPMNFGEVTNLWARRGTGCAAANGAAAASRTRYQP